MQELLGFLSETGHVDHPGLILSKTDLFSVVKVRSGSESDLVKLEKSFDENTLELFRRMRRLRIDILKLRSLSYDNATKNERRVLDALRAYSLLTCSLLRVSKGYYSQSLSYRAQQVGALSVHHLCKSLLFRSSNNCFYLLIVQYTHEVDISMVCRELTRKAGKVVELRLATETETDEVAAYEHNAVAPLGLRRQKDVQLIISETIFKLVPNELFLGGGEINTKLYVPEIFDFKRKTKAWRMQFSFLRED